MDKKIIDIIEQAFENIESINSSSDSSIISAINETINSLDSGKIRVAEKNDNEWIMLSHDQKEIWKNILVNTSNQDIHVMNKRAFDRVIPKLLEALDE